MINHSLTNSNYKAHVICLTPPPLPPPPPPPHTDTQIHMVSYATIYDCNTDTHLCRTTTSMCYGEEHIPHAQQFIWYKHVWYISVHATMKHLNSLTQVNLTTLLGQTLHFIGFEELSQVGHKLQQTTSDDPGRQHTLWSTHIVLFLHTAPSRKQEASNSFMAFLCCSQKWSGALLHMK